MTESPGFLWTVMCFILALGPLIFVHEMGHYLAGRWCGVKADAFSIGFGREVFGWTDKRGTRWKIGWMPLGGYVKFAGDMNPAGAEDPAWKKLPEAERSQVFHAKALWQRALIVFAGPFTNFVAAALIFAGFALLYPMGSSPPVIAEVTAGSPAAKVGLMVGDRITEINGRDIDSFTDVYPIIMDRPGMKISMSVLRAGKPLVFDFVSEDLEKTDKFGGKYRIGRVGIGPAPPVFKKMPLSEVPGYAVGQTIEGLDRTVTGLVQLVTGHRGLKELGGPVKIAKVSGQVATMGIAEFIYMMAMISINLGFINLLPVPMLDGGHLSFYAVEAIRRRPANPQVMELAFRSGMFALLALMVFVTVNDLVS
jgi:regulator of sigma E protease